MSYPPPHSGSIRACKCSCFLGKVDTLFCHFVKIACLKIKRLCLHITCFMPESPEYHQPLSLTPMGTSIHKRVLLLFVCVCVCGGGGGGRYKTIIILAPCIGVRPMRLLFKLATFGQKNPGNRAKPLDFRASNGDKNSGKRLHPPPPPPPPERN